MNTRAPIPAIRVSILPAIALANFWEAVKQAEADVAAHQSLRGGKAGSLRAARRLARRRAGTGPDPKRFDRPPSAEARRLRKRLRRLSGRRCRLPMPLGC